MQINNSYNIASQAINRGVDDINTIAHTIAQGSVNADAETKPVTESLIELKKESQNIKANMHVIKTIQDTEEFLIDIMA